jgi:integrase
MNTVEPIRDIDMVNDIADYLKTKNIRDYVMFMFGIYSGLRISDILKIKVRDVKDKDYIYIHEQKTNKEKRFPIHDELKEILKDYVEGKQDYEHLFKSREGQNKAITRTRAYGILNDAAGKFGLESIGTHTCRKTFGYFLYQQTKDLAAIKEILNHSDISTTLRYIGVVQETKDKIMKKLSYKKRNKRGELNE